MTVRRIGLVLGLSLLAGIAGTASAQSGASQGGSDSMSQGMDNSGEHDAMFMRQAAAAGLAEIQAGRIALDKSSSAQVRQLAQRIIDDHTKANDQLMSIAQRKRVSLPTEPMPMQKQEASRLQSLSGAAFDQAYALAMVRDHRQAVELFDMESRNAMDSDLKQFAGTTLPALRQHLQMAEQIAGGDDMDHGTPMDSNGSMGMPASGSSSR